MKIRLTVAAHVDLNDPEIESRDDIDLQRALQQGAVKRVERWFLGHPSVITATATIERDEQGKT